MEFSLLPSVFHCSAAHLMGRGRAQLSNGPGSFGALWPSCCQSLARTRGVSYFPWPRATFNVQELLAYSFSLAVLTRLLLVLAQGQSRRVLRTWLWMSSFPQKGQHAAGVQSGLVVSYWILVVFVAPARTVLRDPDKITKWNVMWVWKKSRLWNLGNYSIAFLTFVSA